MHLYMSGTPRNDGFQVVENRLCTHRLFSMHGSYEKAVLRWLDDVKDGIVDAKAFYSRYPKRRDQIIAADVARRTNQRAFDGISDDYVRSVCDVDWSLPDVVENMCSMTQTERPYPKFILLDSGAFTAWNLGETTSVDDVLRKYSAFVESAGDLFDEIWMINLDVIPGERGRDPTPQELADAVVESDKNFQILTREFGDVVMPVFHQGEDSARLNECMDQVDGTSNYICLSPRNDLAESHRVKWSADCHRDILAERPHMRTHGLATTGNEMIRSVPWYSGDSAAWIQHGGYGMIDIFHDDDASFAKKSVAHYMNYFTTLDNVSLDPVHKDAAVMQGGKINDSKHVRMRGAANREFIRNRVERTGMLFPVTAWLERSRNIVCLAEFVAFAEWDEQQKKPKFQQSLLGGL